MPHNKQYPIKIEVDTDVELEETYSADYLIINTPEAANALRNALNEQTDRVSQSMIPLNEWISVSDRLPADDQYVLVKLKGYVFPFDVCQYTMVFKMEFVANTISLTQSVTHWQPLNV